MSYICIVFIKSLLLLFYCQDPNCTVHSVILKWWNACYCPFVCAQILPPHWNFTPKGFNEIHWTEENCFCKTPLKLETYKISNNEITCLLRIGNIAQYWPIVWVCVWVCVCVFECVTFSCDSHNIPPICLFWKLDIHIQFNTLPQLIFISWPDLCIS